MILCLVNEDVFSTLHSAYALLSLQVAPSAYKIDIRHLPVQIVPFPVKPSLHMHL